MDLEASETEIVDPGGFQIDSLALC